MKQVAVIFGTGPGRFQDRGIRGLSRNRLQSPFFACSCRFHRCGQPGQQQGRRFPLDRSSIARSMRRVLVSAFFADSIQQIHSFRAIDEMSFQASKASGSEARLAFRSGGSL